MSSQTDLPAWAGPEEGVAQQVAFRSGQCLGAYRANPSLVEEHANLERALLQGGYGRRQLFELVQNGADAMVGYPGGRIQVVLTETALYCANEGESITEAGVGAMLGSHLSPKRGVEIGRFGLGFKSVLGVSGAPEFFSTSGSFRFDPDQAAERIRAVVPDADRTPTLRMAWPLDPEQEAEHDSVLADLMGWATTVVRLRRSQGTAAWLGRDVARFPAQFLLFSPHVGELTFTDVEAGTERSIRVLDRGGSLELTDSLDASTSSWVVLSKVVRPSEHARRDAGELADRRELPLVWAVPLSGRERMARGRFWAFFPTQDATTLSGIVNAPWKLSEDRLRLIEGPFNEELIWELVGLVCNHLDVLLDPDDPGVLLDLVPARGRESPSWADGVVTEAFYELATDTPIIPDGNGDLVEPGKIRLHPAGIPLPTLQRWATAPVDTAGWAHWSVETTITRRSRVEKLLAAVGRRIASLSEWLEALVPTPLPELSAAAVEVAADLLQRLAKEYGTGTVFATAEGQVREAEIVLSDDRRLLAPDPARVFIPGTYRPERGDLVFVAPELARDDRVVAALATLRIREVDARLELRARLVDGTSRWAAAEWATFWQLAGRLRWTEVLSELEASGSARATVRVRTVSGGWKRVDAVLLPGPVVPSDGSRDADLAVDTGFHASTAELLPHLGVAAAPLPGAGSPKDDWFLAYRKKCIHRYLAQLPRGSNPQRDFIEVVGDGRVGALHLLEALSPVGRARLTAAALEAEPRLDPWMVRHRSRSEDYPTLTVTHPTVHRLQSRGLINSSLGLCQVGDCVGPTFGAVSSLLPVARLSTHVAEALRIPTRPEEIAEEIWRDALRRALESDDLDRARALYRLAVRHVDAPDRVLAQTGSRIVRMPPAEVVAVCDDRQFELLARTGVLCLQADRDLADLLVERWGLRRADELIRTEFVAVPSGPPTPVTDLFPALQLLLPASLELVETVRCSELLEEMVTDLGKSTRPVLARFDGRTLHWQENLDEERLLETIDRELQLGLTADAKRSLLEGQGEQLRRQRIRAIRQEPTLEAKLLAAIGEEDLRRRLPASLIASIEERSGPLAAGDLAELAHAVYGVDVLHECRQALQDADLYPPLQWAGSPAARDFVASLGFPREYAGFPTARRDPMLEVDGPSGLPPLHAFQSTMKERVRTLLRQRREPARALLSLPTGAGKTRVAAESCTDAFREGDLDGVLLWVAQSDELCEQAVQSWSEVWRTFGPSERLTISRLWGGNEARPAEAGPQVVVATVHKLQVCIPKPSYQWLATARAVVIDEAHLSTTRMYTEMLEWLGLGRGAERCPLLGLSATPFRGTNEKETEQLVARYRRNRIDEGVLGDDPYTALQDLGVLAKVDHQLLEGVALNLSRNELDELQRLHRLPSSVEARLGTNTERNGVLLRSMIELPDDWPILLFGTSVEHAQTMAGLLRREGVTCATISGTTDPGARRFYIDEFRRGRIRVLTNFSVLTHGFDAPAVRAVYVARPTFSPSLYQQMIGRGLRGPMNGGKDVCLIVNVEDTFSQFGEQLAFRAFEHLWNARERS